MFGNAVMTMPTITAFYAGILGLMAVGLAFAVGQVRGQTGIALGDGGNEELIAAMRRHANFIEFVPLMLILMGLLEMNRVSGNVLHALGTLIVVARVLHAVGMKAGDGGLPRVLGAAGSTLAIVVASVWAITLFF